MNGRTNVALTLILFLIAGPVVASASASASAGKAKSQTCVACHGEAGISVNPLWPNLAGQKKEYLQKQMLDFKEDRRRDPLMSPVSKTLSLEDIQDLAEYYSSLK